ncbi:hypothetical protein TNCV_769761 [Trichonephila clavipes]|nr:hypothetical protein TNCV_769761 [Trichonephila clavipes]
MRFSIPDGQFELLLFHNLIYSIRKRSLPKETSLDAFSGKESESKNENVESEFENIPILGFAFQTRESRDSPTKEDSFVEALGNGSCALGDFLLFLDNFQVDQSNLPFRFNDPNSGSVEFKQNTADELFFEEPAPGWKIETTSDIRFAMDSRNTNYVPEGTRGQYGSLTSSQLDLFDSNRRTSLTKEILLDAISGRENEIRFENVEPKHKQMKPNSIVNGLISSQSYTNTGIAVEGYDLSTNENHSNFEIKIHRPLYFKQFKSENPAQKYLHSHEENFQYGVQELNVSQVRNLSESKPTHSNKKNSIVLYVNENFFTNHVSTDICLFILKKNHSRVSYVRKSILKGILLQSTYAISYWR